MKKDKGKAIVSQPSSESQKREDYNKKAPETFTQAVCPTTPIKKEEIQNSFKEEKKFEFLPIQVILVLTLDKEYENFRVEDFANPCYTDKNYVEVENPLKTRKFYEAILVDTDSIEIEQVTNPDYISYSKFTIKRILTPFKWQTDHLHTPISLSMEHKPQIYNWFDYKAVWYNFTYLRPRHTWFVKYSDEIHKTVIPRWFYEWWNHYGGNKQILSKQFLHQYPKFTQELEITTLPENIQIC